ncbi:MAG: cellulase family glycosylhydrolase, partial [Desulfobacteraceae bacterium]
MKKSIFVISLLVFIILPFSTGIAFANWKIEFWDIQRKGAHGEGGTAKEGGANPEDWFKSAYVAGLDFVRLCPVDWKGEGRDFLIGDADQYTSLPKKDISKLKNVLDIAHRHHIKVVLTMFSLPGARYRQDNNGQSDYRLWTDETFQKQTLQFWKDLASELRSHPAIVGYNPLNEPYPSRKAGFEGGGKLDGFETWLHNNKGKTPDLNRFNQRIVDAIRLVDTKTPIILDCWFHSDPKGFRYLFPVNDKATIYAFHYYGRWDFATYRINK